MGHEEEGWTGTEKTEPATGPAAEVGGNTSSPNHVSHCPQARKRRGICGFTLAMLLSDPGKGRRDSEEEKGVMGDGEGRGFCLDTLVEPGNTSLQVTS